MSELMADQGGGGGDDDDDGAAGGDDDGAGDGDDDGGGRMICLGCCNLSSDLFVSRACKSGSRAA